jgi:hypothetical protein
MTIDVAETLHGFIDGAIGTSECDNFNAEMIPLRNKLEKLINKKRLEARKVNNPKPLNLC